LQAKAEVRNGKVCPVNMTLTVNTIMTKHTCSHLNI